VLGVALARLYLWTPIHDGEIAVTVLMQFLSTFAVWLLAEAMGVSAIIAMVGYAMTLARYGAVRISGRRRIASYAVWEVAVFVLNVLAFIFIGLQLRDILTRVQGSDSHLYALFAVSICVTVIVTRIAWVMFYNAASRWKRGHFAPRSSKPAILPSIGGGFLISWCGMRGIVTLATALALPDGSPETAFPYRDLIVLSAFCVVLSTLVVQGITLRPLLKILNFKDDGTVQHEVDVAYAETARVALQILDGYDPHPAVDLLRREYRARLSMGDVEDKNSSDVAQYSQRLRELQRELANTQRRALTDLRARLVIGDDAFHVVEAEIDLLDLSADARVHPQLKMENKG
jgi:CPA1 family monovalent cation:H+ antiporter